MSIIVCKQTIFLLCVHTNQYIVRVHVDVDVTDKCMQFSVPLIYTRNTVQQLHVQQSYTLLRSLRQSLALKKTARLNYCCRFYYFIKQSKIIKHRIYFYTWSRLLNHVQILVVFSCLFLAWQYVSFYPLAVTFVCSVRFAPWTKCRRQNVASSVFGLVMHVACACYSYVYIFSNRAFFHPAP